MDALTTNNSKNRRAGQLDQEIDGRANDSIRPDESGYEGWEHGAIIKLSDEAVNVPETAARWQPGQGHAAPCVQLDRATKLLDVPTLEQHAMHPTPGIDPRADRYAIAIACHTAT